MDFNNLLRIQNLQLAHPKTDKSENDLVRDQDISASHLQISKLDRIICGEYSLSTQLMYIIVLCICTGILSFACYAIITKPSFFYLNSFSSSFIRALLLFGLLGELINLTGYLTYRNDLKEDQKNINLKSSFLVAQIVSKGNNLDVLKNTVRHSLAILNQELKNPFLVRIVADKRVEKVFTKSEKEQIQFIHVPNNYVCKNKSRFKARALEYARLNSNKTINADFNTWTVFLDEESILSSSAVRAIRQFIGRDKDMNTIAQGFITYTAGKFPKPFIPAAVDCIRVGLDLGKYFVQFRFFHRLLTGFHGSFFITSEKVINLVGFDLGPQCSIAEDICFAARASQKGVRFDWLTGYVREQSPETLVDLIKQRRRWACGMASYICDNTTPILTRLSIFASTIGLKLASVFTMIALLVGYDELGKYGYLFALTFTVKPSLIMGLFLTILDWNEKNILNKMIFSLNCIILAPVLMCIETLTPIYALIFPERNFHVVHKSLK